MLDVEGITAGYEDLEVVHDFSMRLNDGAIACIIGPNGSGKSTVLKTIMGIVRPTQGKISLDGDEISGLEPHKVVRKGICFLPQGRTAFPMMSVQENLEVGSHILNDKKKIQERRREAFSLFPVLEKKRKDTAIKLSGGELTMLCIARAMMSHPRVLLLDEPSLGLAPKVADHVCENITEINARGSSIVIVEQNVRRALGIASYAYVIASGRKRFEGKCEEILHDERLKDTFLGAT